MEIIINVEGRAFIVDRERLLTWLTQNAKTFTTNQPNIHREVTRQDEQGRSVLNG